MTRSQKSLVNLDLKVAIVRSGYTARYVATRTRIPEVRLSQIVNGAREATAKERKALAAFLDCDETDLFADALSAAS